MGISQKKPGGQREKNTLKPEHTMCANNFVHHIFLLSGSFLPPFPQRISSHLHFLFSS